MIFQREQTRYRTTRKNVRYHIYKKKKKSHTQTHNTFSTLEKRQRAVIKRKALSSSASQKSRKSNRWLERKKGKRDLVLDANITIRCHGVSRWWIEGTEKRNYNCDRVNSLGTIPSAWFLFRKLFGLSPSSTETWETSNIIRDNFGWAPH